MKNMKKLLLMIMLTTGMQNACMAGLKDSIAWSYGAVYNKIARIGSVVHERGKSLWRNHPRWCIGAGIVGFSALAYMAYTLKIRHDRLKAQLEDQMIDKVKRELDAFFGVTDSDEALRADDSASSIGSLAEGEDADSVSSIGSSAEGEDKDIFYEPLSDHEHPWL